MRRTRFVSRTKAAGTPSNSAEDPKASDERDRLWRWVLHEDNILATRVSFFLLAESILIAITATTVNTFAGLPARQQLVRDEVFGLAIALGVAGFALTGIFWYVFKINYHSVTVLTKRLRLLDDLYKDLDDCRKLERQDIWYFRGLFRGHGVNWVVNNLLPEIILLIWSVVTYSAVAIFLSH
jgi:hypothetical protein